MEISLISEKPILYIYEPEYFISLEYLQSSQYFSASEFYRDIPPSLFPSMSHNGLEYAAASFLDSSRLSLQCISCPGIWTWYHISSVDFTNINFKQVLLMRVSLLNSIIVHDLSYFYVSQESFSLLCISNFLAISCSWIENAYAL